MLDYVRHPNCVEVSVKGYVFGIEVRAFGAMWPDQETSLANGKL